MNDLLSLSLPNPLRGIGIRFWHLGSGLYLGYSVKSLSDKKGTILLPGWQIISEKSSVSGIFPYQLNDKLTVKRLLIGIYCCKEKKYSMEKINAE